MTDSTPTTIADAVPTIEETNAILYRKLGWPLVMSQEAGHLYQVSNEQLQALVRVLGWHPTPTKKECLSDLGEFCCPQCGATRIEHVADGPCDLRDVDGFNADEELVITNRMSACGSEGDWWMQCRLCVFEFELPHGLEVKWK